MKIDVVTTTNVTSIKVTRFVCQEMKLCFQKVEMRKEAFAGAEYLDAVVTVKRLVFDAENKSWVRRKKERSKKRFSQIQIFGSFWRSKKSEVKIIYRISKGRRWGLDCDLVKGPGHFFSISILSIVWIFFRTLFWLVVKAISLRSDWVRRRDEDLEEARDLLSFISIFSVIWSTFPSSHKVPAYQQLTWY